MLVIRDRQLKALARSALARWLTEHLRKFFPDECEALGEAGLREEIRYGLERAAAHGFTSEDHLAQYLDLMFTFGRDFERNPALPWAEPILTDAAVTPGTRMKRLREAALQDLGVTVPLDSPE